MVNRAKLIGEVVLQDSALPSPSLLDSTDVSAWTDAAANDPYREGALRFELNGHDVLARYRPASDRLTVSSPEPSMPTSGSFTEPATILELSEAAEKAQGCLAQLEFKGVLGEGEMSRDHYYASSRPTYVESSGAAWVDYYSFGYHPNIDGLPLTSSEVIVSVNASTGRCQRITVGGQVTLQRIADATVELTSEATAEQLIRDKVAADGPVAVTEVHIDGHFGYYLPLTSAEATLRPQYIATYATQAGGSEMPMLSRRKFIALPLVSPESAGLVDLLGPDW